MSQDDIVIVSFARTPLGNLLGILKDFSAHALGSHVLKASIERAYLKPSDIHEVIMGCVLPAGQGQAPARQASIHAGIPNTTSCTTINKVCGSGMKSIMFSYDMLKAGTGDIFAAGGMESMTQAPYLLLKARQGYRLSHSTLYDHMMLDGLEDAYDQGKAMGCFAETCAFQNHFSRKEQDDFAIQSFERAIKATNENLFKDEIAPIRLKTKKGDEIISNDEHPFSVDLKRIPTLKPVFEKEGTVTAGNSSSISDGAAVLILMRATDAEKRGIKPLAKILGHASAAKTPAEFTTAPIDATRKLLTQLKWSEKDIDLFEVNEAFAVVVLAFMKSLQIPHEKINIHGGAVALGHPIGASGARIVITLLGALKQNHLKRGIATLCIGGGEATAIAIEMI